jgi:putative iron-regulated protein
MRVDSFKRLSNKNKMRKLTLLSFALAMFVVLACSDDEDNGPAVFDTTLEAAISNYADIVLANYEDAKADAAALSTAVNRLIATPSEATMDAAKQAWLTSRESYGQTEAFRLYGGPIDDDNGPEGQLNAWPLDESYIDYVTGITKFEDGDESTNDASNIINNPTDFATIDKNTLSGLNEDGGETNVSTGYHAVEFLLWGQDVSIGAGGGERSYTDYVTDGSGTNGNQDRRGQYLMVVSDLIIDDLQSLVDEWSTGGSFRTTFTSATELENSLESILSGIGKLSKGELAGERMFAAWDLRSKENEHSCFSDNTHRDIVTNAKGIRNVYLGTYARTSGVIVSGTSMKDLLTLRNAALATEIETIINSNVTSAEAIQAPFDQEFLAEPGRTRIQTSFQGLRNQGDKIAEAAAEFGFTLDPSGA